MYVAREGINAQMAVPSTVLAEFIAASRTAPLLSSPAVHFNAGQVVTRAEFLQRKVFKSLHIRLRAQILTDGLSEASSSISNSSSRECEAKAKIDWDDAGEELDAFEWHNKLGDPAAVVIDCRNSYESDIGGFEHPQARALNTIRFSESWGPLMDLVGGLPRDAPIMTYCTGGIRCVKINAFLSSRGFTRTSRLKGGIISYARDLLPLAADANANAGSGSGSGSGVVSRFRGANYVFDERMGASVTADTTRPISVCETCGADSCVFTNCSNERCAVRVMMGCSVV